MHFGFWVDAIMSSAKTELRSTLQATAEKVQGLKAATCPWSARSAELGPPVLGHALKVGLIYVHVTDLKILQWLKTLEPI